MTAFTLPHHALSHRQLHKITHSIPHTHAHTHTHTHTNTHTQHTHMHMHTRTHTQHTHTHTFNDLNIQLIPHACMYVHNSANVCAHNRVRTHVCTQTHSHIHTHKYTNTRRSVYNSIDYFTRIVLYYIFVNAHNHYAKYLSKNY